MEQTPFHLHGKKILVTGASSGIGKATVHFLKQMGADVIITARDQERLHQLAFETGISPHDIFSCDLNNKSERDILITAISNIDGMVYCAGVVHPFPVKFIDERKIEETMKINYEAAVLLTGGLLKHKKINNGSSLVYLSSISSQRPLKGATLYGGSKAALEAFVKVLAQETAPQKIRANSVSPAMVKTPMFDRAAEMVSKEEMDKHIATYPLGVGYPEDVAHAVSFLLSPASRWITGTNIILDGGLLL